MAYTEVTHEGWFSRLAESIKGVLLGVLFFLIAFPLLFWNEGRAVHRARGLAAGKGQVVSITPGKVDPAQEGKLVYLSGDALAAGALSDDTFAVQAPEALRLRRVVEMFQWKQHEERSTRKKVGGGKETTRTYTYEQVWSDDLLSSGSYKERGHDNPKQMPYPSAVWDDKQAKLGAFKLGELTSKLDGWQQVTVEKSAQPALKLVDGGLYKGASSDSPAVGDVRIRFEKVAQGPVSVLAVQTGSGFSRFTSGQGDAGLFEAVVGTQGPDEMFQALESQNAVLAWILRGVGFFLMVIGLFLIVNPLVVVADVLPLLGNLVGAGAFFAAIALAAPLTLATIALGWIAYRPLLGVALLAAAGGIVWFASKRTRKV